MHEGDAGDVVIAMYRPKAGADDRVRALLARHVRSLRSWGFATDRPVVLLRAADGVYLEIFEWVHGAVERAHSDPRVREMWGEFGAACDFGTLAELPSATHPFPHFRVVEGITV